MKKFTSVLLFVSLFLSGCAAQSEKHSVSTNGSTSMEKVVGFLSEAYMEENENVSVFFNPTGSGSGIRAVNDGTCDIGLSSRNLTSEESEYLNATVIAIDGMGIVVNKSNPINDLTIDALKKIYIGEATMWSDVGGDSIPIVCIGRESASGTRDGFEEATGTKGLCKYSQELTSSGDVLNAVAANPNAIGYASLASIKDNVKVLSIDGISPTSDSVQSGEYKIQRSFIFVTKKDVPLSDDAQGFFDFATSSAADEFIVMSGSVPVKH
jgi:phosphate transport system substrate-binding protein